MNGYSELLNLNLENLICKLEKIVLDKKKQDDK